MAAIFAWLGQRAINWVVYFLFSTVVVWGLYAGLIRPITKPNPTSTSTQAATTIYNYTLKPTFGCMRVPLPTDKQMGVKK